MDPRRNTELGLERIVFFSDAVMAIAITLLAIELRVPEVAREVASQQLLSALIELSPKLTSFVTGFVIIGVYWLSHHRYFEYIRRYDNRLALLNLLFLLFIAVLPASTSLLGEYPYVSLAVVVYAGNVAALGLASALLWLYATRHQRLTDPNLEEAFARSTLRRALFAPAVFLVSIPIALVNPRAALLIWWLSPLPLAALFASRFLGRYRQAGHMAAEGRSQPGPFSQEEGGTGDDVVLEAAEGAVAHEQGDESTQFEPLE